MQECLGGYFIGMRLSFKVTELALKNAWGLNLVEVISNGRGFFFFHVSNGDFRKKVLEGGPITVARVPLVLQ